MKNRMMGMAALLFCFAPHVTAQAQASNHPTCDEQFTSTTTPTWIAPKACSNYERGLKSVFRQYEDGTAIPNQRLTRAIDNGPPTAEIFKETENLVRITKASPAKVALTKEFVRILRSELIGQIQQGMSDEALSPVQRHLVGRVKAMREVIGAKDGDCDRLTPQAAYDAASNTLVVCASLMNFPNEALLPILSHELAHAVEPCVLEGFYNPRRNNSLHSAKGRIAAFRACHLPKSDDAANSSRLASTMKQPYDVLDFKDASSYATFLRCDFMKIKSSGLTADDLKKSPFADAFSCVDELTGKREEKLSSLVNKMAKVGMSESERSTAKSVDLGLAQNQTCSREGAEMYADRVGAQLAAGYLAHHASSIAENKAKDILYDLAVDNCERRGKSQNYADGNDRLRVFLQYPEFQRAVGCQGLLKSPLCPAPVAKGTGSSVPPTVR